MFLSVFYISFSWLYRPPPLSRDPDLLPCSGCVRSRAPAALPGLLGHCPALPCPAWSPQAVTAPRAGGQLPEARGVCGCLLVALTLHARLEWGFCFLFSLGLRCLTGPGPGFLLGEGLLPAQVSVTCR